MADTKIRIVLEAVDAAKANIARVSQEISKLQGAGSTATSAFKGTTSAIGGVMARLGPMAAAVTAAFSVTAIISFTRNVLNAVDSLKDFSEEVGLSIETVAGLEFGAATAGLEKGQFEAGLRLFAGNIAEAADQTSRASEVFAAMGVATKSASGELLPLNTILESTFQAFSGYANGAEKAKLAQELFGRSGTRFIPLMEQGKEGIAAYTAEFSKLSGGSVTDAAMKADEFHDAMARVQVIVQGLVLQLASEFLPALTTLIQEFTGSSTAAQLLKVAMDVVIAAVRVAALAVADLVDKLGLIGRVAGLLSQGEFKAAANEIADTWKRGINRQLEATNELLDLINGKTKRTATNLQAVKAPDTRAKAPIAPKAQKEEAVKTQKDIADAEFRINQQRLASTSDMFSNMAGAAKAFGAKGLAAYKAFAIAGIIVDTAKAAMAAFAAMSGIPVVGWILAPIAAAAAVAFGAAQISAVSSVSAGFAAGGYTGDGGKYEPAGTVHRGEFVIPAESVSKWGPAYFSQFLTGAGPQSPVLARRASIPSYATGGYVNPASAAKNTSVNIAVVNSRQEQRDFQRREGMKMTVDYLNKRSNRVRV